MARSNWNYIKVIGNNNLVIQDATGNSFEIAIEVFIERFTHEKNEQIKILKATISDKRKLQRYSEDKIIQLSKELKILVEEVSQLHQRINKMLFEFNGKDFSKASKLYQQAFDLFINGKLDLAIDLLNDSKLQEELDKIENLETKMIEEKKKLAETYSLKGRMQMLKFDFTGAIGSSKKAASLDPSNAVNLSNLGTVFFNAGKFNDALTNLEQAIQLINNKSSEETQEKGENYVVVSNILIELADYERAYEYLQKALVIAEDTKILHLKIDVLKGLGKLSSQLGDEDGAIDYDKKAYDLAKQYDLDGGNLSKLANNLGVAYHTKGVYEKSLEYFEISLKLDKQSSKSDLDIGGMIFFNMGCAKSSLGQKKEALDLITKAINIDTLLYTENSLRLAIYYHGIGPVLQDEDIEKAKQYLFLAIRLREEFYPEMHPLIAETYATLGIVLQESDPFLSINSFRKAINIREKLFGFADVKVAGWYALLIGSYIKSKDQLNALKCTQKAWLRMQLHEKLKLYNTYEAINGYLKTAHQLLSSETLRVNSPYAILIDSWDGVYSYENAYDNKQFSFTLYLQSSLDGNISGTCIEYFDENERPRIAIIKGNAKANLEIEFKKLYLDLNGINDEESESIENSKLIYKGKYWEQSERFIGSWLTHENDYIFKGYWQMAKV